ncbi:MAG: lipid II flippase MurJ [Flaviflexus sp.]|nr:lipid II flippase MurJ [Flaviflexus sp.]
MKFRGLTQTVAGAAGVIAVLTLAARAIGFLRTLIESWVLGATPLAEAYSTANNVPNVLFEVAAGGALAGVVVPLLSGFLATGEKEKADRTASALLTWVMVAGVPVAALLILLADPVAGALLPGAAEAVRATAASLLRIFAVQVPLYGASVVLTGILQAHRRFILPALAPLLSSIVVIASFGIFWMLTGGASTYSVSAAGAALAWLGWGTTAGVFAFAAPQLIPVFGQVQLRPTFRFPQGVARRALTMASAGFGGLVAQQAAIVLIMVAANATGGGTYPIFKYAQAIYFLPYAIFAVPIATAMYPRIAERAALPGQVGLGRMVSGSIRLIIAAAAVGAAMLAAAAPEAEIIFSLVHTLPGLSTTITVLALAVAGYSVLYHTTRVLFALDCPSRAFLASLIGWSIVALGAVGAMLVVPDTGMLQALAWSMTAGMSAAGIIGIRQSRRAIGPEVYFGLARTCLLSFLGALAGALAGRWLGTLVMDLAGHTFVAAIGAGVLAALVAAALPAALLAWRDRSTWRVREWAVERGAAREE